MADRAVAGEKKFTHLANSTIKKAPHVGKHVLRRKDVGIKGAHHRHAAKADKTFKKKRDFF